jgi:hypothetical protein
MNSGQWSVASKCGYGFFFTDHWQLTTDHLKNMNTYIFPGLWPFIERVARGRDLHQLGRAREFWHCKQIQDSLGQLPRLDRASQRQLLEHVLKVRESLAVALEGIDAAILEVAGAIDLPVPEGNDHEDAASAEKSAKKRSASPSPR